MKNLTQHTQDYLKAIYELQTREGTASTTSLAARLNIEPASVTGMIQRLAAATPPLVDYRKHQGARLTQEGEQAALEVIRHHRLIEAYLVQELGFPWESVHEEACRLEHVISEELESRIAETLGNPERDPHGELIPSADLVMPSDPSLPLLNLRPPQKASIQRVCADDPALLKHLASLGLLLGTSLQVLDYSPFDQNLRLMVNDRELVLGPAVTAQIFVSKIKET
jgi:DtxR family Mn-dependent transcriptional regulator